MRKNCNVVGVIVIDKNMIDEAFRFYNIDELYKEKCYKCAEEINKNECYKKVFNKVYETLYYSEFFAIKELSSVFISEFGNLLSTTSSADFKIVSFFLLVYTFPGT